jgi:hypothetical protein
LKVVDIARNDVVTQPSTVRVLLRPARYILREAITIGDGPASNNQTFITVELATLEHFPESFHPSALEAARNATSSPAEPEPTKKRKKTLRNLLSCRTVDVAEEEPAVMVDNAFAMDIDLVDGGGIPSEMLLENHPIGGNGLALATASVSSSSSSQSDVKVHRASLLLRTRRHNEPLLRIRQGSCTVRNIELKHICHGTGEF